MPNPAFTPPITMPPSPFPRPPLRLLTTATTSTTPPSNPPLRLLNLRGETAYTPALNLQHALVTTLKSAPSTPDTLILLEHPPIYTLGTSSTLSNVLFDPTTTTSPTSPALIRTERGGEVTYHGPGQLIAYPILNLARHKKDLHWYLRSLESAVIRMLRDAYDVRAGRKEGLTGVWVRDEKICALGLKVSRWITMHGLAINVAPDMDMFRRIHPCGITDFPVTCLRDVLGGVDVDMEDVRENFQSAFREEFGPYDVMDVTERQEELCLNYST